MNCKPGDLARIVAPYNPKYIGLFVRVVGKATVGVDVRSKDGRISNATGKWGVAWVCEAHDASFPHVVADGSLRPIRPGGITDEEVRDLYLPAPQKETA